MPVGYGLEIELKWEALESKGDAPNKRSGHTLTFTEDSSGSAAYLFGGCDHSHPPGPTNDLYRLSLQENTWTNLSKLCGPAEKIPCGRWRHSATLINSRKILIFGGFTKEARLNDVWLLDIGDKEKSWSQPAPSKKGVWANLPIPRGAHSASLLGNKLYIFGGYGGTGYGRRDFNDVYVLDVKSWTWDQINPDGEAPEPRSGHKACFVDKKLYICGGWNSMKQFNDLHILDTENMTWSKPDISFSEPRWNHSILSVWAVPNWKIFCFGGNSGNLAESAQPQGSYLNDVLILDCHAGATWRTHKVIGEPPKARSDTDLIYDKKGNRIILFGGWANRWFGDLYALHVGEIVGPPYSVTSVQPKLGAVTGSQSVKIVGQNFIAGNATVRFAVAKGYIDVQGQATNSSTIEVTTPSFEKFGPLMTEVRVSMPGEGVTNTAAEFKFHSVSFAANCIAFGPGLLRGGAVGFPTSFIINARDKDGNDRDSGGDEWKVSILFPADTDVVINPKVEDRQDGSYLITYLPSRAGEYTVAVDFLGTFNGVAGPIRGSVFKPSFEEGKEKELNTLEGALMMNSIKEITKELRDYCTNSIRGLKKQLADDDLNGLIRVQEFLYSVEEKKVKTQYNVDVTHASLKYLKSHGTNVERDLSALDTVTVQWVDLQKQVPITQTAIVPHVKLHSSNTEDKIKKYGDEMKKKMESFRKLDFWAYSTGAKAARASIQNQMKVWEKERKTADENLHLCRMFNFLQHMNESNQIITDMKAQMDYMLLLWDVVEGTQGYIESSKEMLWEEVDANSLEDEAKALMKQIKALHKDVRWSDAYKMIDKTCKDFLNTCPLIQVLHHQSMRRRHWEALMRATKKEFTVPTEDPTLKLRDLLNLNLHEFSSDVEEITDQAIKEEKMEQQLKKLADTWTVVEWVMEPYKDTDVPLLKMSEEDFEMLENDQLTVQGMLASRYVKQFETEVGGWQKSLANASEILQLLTEIQRTWSYLEPLFIHSEEVKRELPEDAVRFEGIDADVKAVLKAAWTTKNVKDSCNVEGLYKRLEGIMKGLELCKKSLADFLDGRRRQFPRYYFMSEADLLDVLSNGSDPEKILIHVPKIYLATKTFELEKIEGQRPRAVRFVSGVGQETLTFEPPVDLEGKVEIYMQVVLDAMKSTLFQHVKRSIKSYAQMERTAWLMHANENGEPVDAAQIALLVSAIYYVQEVEQTFRKVGEGNKNALAEYNVKQCDQLSALIRLTQSNLSKAARQRVMCMITMDAHARDIVAKMVREQVEEASAFQWQSQLKQEFRVPTGSFTDRDPTLRGDGGERAQIRIADAIVPYDYEYLGNGPRLVITALTDRIYVTATQALNLKMGCAPAGPAGTGKTETTKDLASALGKVCYVFNCSPEMDYLSLGNIFKGLASSGSWGCFDEFNRLVPEVLSVCSVQFKSVLDGIKANSKRIVIEGDEVNLDPTCGAFITMNPGYLGRSELPEGLKALFRPITVMVPDLVLICENMLMAEGFTEAKILASKFYGLYSLLGQLLSKQLHYDWGLRAVKSVLVVAGSFKRAEPNLPESHLLMRALRDFNTPKIVAEDNVVFFGLLGDLFPGVDPPRKIDYDLEEYVTNASLELGLHPDENFRLKVVQLEELLAIRHCVFTMGPPGAGKSQSWRTLAKARTLRGDPTKVVDLNPKAVSTEELYGFITMATREWKDGLLSKIMRDLGQIPNEKPKWIVLDGDLDANWIESMNSVMDDNKMLTLASNERIPLKPYMRMIFEIRDLKYATPATVSRAGILYISTDSGFQWKSSILSWIKKREDPQEVKDQLQALFDEYVPGTLTYIRKNLAPIIPMEDVTLVQSLIFMLEAILTPDNVSDRESLAMAFVFCCVWAFGSSLTLSDDGTDYAKQFSDWWRNEWKSVKFPSRDTVFDYWLDPKEKKFDSWTKSSYFYTVDYDSSIPMSQITVPTPETCSVSFWMQNLVNHRRPVLLAGPAGTGKTQMVLGMLGKLNQEERVYSNINFNFYTTSAVLQSTMEIPLEKKTGTNYGPPGKKNLIYFIDDLNLPEVDPYNTQSAIALLRQHMEYEHVYDRAKLILKNISSTQVIACMNPTAGSFLVDPRLQRLFCTFAIGLPGPTSLLTIYQTFLDGHLKKFSEEVKSLSTNLIKSALGLHSSVAQTFRKTAANFHYEFNIRHLSNVFQGLLVSGPEQFSDAQKFVRLWLHESERVYGDRLVSPEDLQKYQSLAQAQVKKIFPNYNFGRYFASENADPLVFCHFAQNIQDKIYDQVATLEKLQSTLDDALREYNETNATMDLVLFEDALKHVARIVRIILNTGGHALLVGVGGSGKQSLSRLASFICTYTVKQITISSTYSMNDFKEDLKWMYNKAGVRDEGVTFLLTDSQIANEKFLIYINDLLASGNIPDLYTTEEQDAIINNLTSKAKGAGLALERKIIWDFFLGFVRKNLHVVLCFSPVGDDFRNRARKFPALVNCTVIDWFQPWPRDALWSVGKRFLTDIDLGDETSRAGIENFMPFSFESVNQVSKRFFKVERRFVYTTPKSYLELLKLYNQLLTKKRKEFDIAIERLSNGLQKLAETGQSVAKLEEQLKVALVAAEEKRTVAEAIAEEVGQEKAKVEVETNKAQEEAKICASIQADVTIQQRSCESDLAKAEPAVAQAMAALDTLNKKDLGECKTMSKPPTGVDDIFAATMVLLAGVHPGVVVQKTGKVKDRSWDAAKKQLLSNVNEYLDFLKDFKNQADKGNVPSINWKEIRPFLELEHFKPEVIASKNSAAAGVCSWVINIVQYYDIVTTVEPKRLALKEADQKLAEANARLKTVTELVAQLQAKLDKLMADFEAANKEKQDALESVERGNRKLDLAQRLTGALASENIRWKVNVEKLNGDKSLLVGDVLLASAFISYIGPFTKPFRDELINNKWVPFLQKAANGASIKMSESTNPLAILTNDAEVAQWNTEGLPSDRVSTENGAIVCNTARWPLIIDPQLQGVTWLREKEGGSDRNLQVVRLGQADLLRKLERAIENGHSILIENLGERIDAVLNPIIQRATTKKGHRMYIKLGDKEVEFHANFRLFLHTKLSNPHFPPELQAECTLINFTVTSLGLEDQLLSLVVRKERPDLAAKAEELVQQQNLFKIKVKELEDNILYKLATAQGDITEDVELIEGLEETKRISNDINQKVELAKITQASIANTSEKYRPTAARGSLLFFLMNDLVKIHTYYIYSLGAFQAIFTRGIDVVSQKKKASEIADGASPDIATVNATGNANAGDEPPREATDAELAERCKVLNQSITKTVFNYIRRGLFERDKLTVAAQLCLKIMVRDGLLQGEEVDYLVVGKQSSDPGNMGPLAEWLYESIWGKLKALEGLKVFQGLGDAMQSDSDEWRKWFDSEAPETSKIPGELGKLGAFHRLILLRAMRPDRATMSLKTFVADNLGVEYVSQPPFDMASTYVETDPSTPIFFVLFPGVDPTPWVEKLGRQYNISFENGNFINISMGQGQEKPAEGVVERFAKEGGWVMLQNVHLMQTWTPRLERLLEIASENAHANFRCFISAEPPPLSSMRNMPESLMQSCIKVANEAPSDIQSNLRRAWANFSEDRVSTSTKPSELKSCLFALCWFHAIVLGRRRFGQQGWSRAYSFNTGDLTICADVLFNYLDANPVVPWDDLRYIFGEIMYGGHITDAWDRRTNNTYLEVYMNVGLFEKMELGPGFRSPDFGELDYAGYGNYLETAMPPESPQLFGLHPNAEIGYLTNTTENLFTTILSISGGGGGGAGGGRRRR